MEAGHFQNRIARRLAKRFSRMAFIGERRMHTSSILAFRALTFLAEEYAIRFNSESLRTLSGEMEPVAGHPSGDPALPWSWRQLWRDPSERTLRDAASVAILFL
jgi:hypothetical protein